MTDYTDLVDRLRVSRFKDSTAAEYDINGVEAERLQAADAIEALQRENALLRGAAEAAKLGREARAEGMALRMREWGLPTLKQMQDERDAIGQRRAEQAKRLEDAWNAAPEGEHIPFGPEIRIASDNKNYPDSIGGEVTPLGNQADGDGGFT